LVLERFLEVEVREERANGGNKEPQFRFACGFFTLMMDWALSAAVTQQINNVGHTVIVQETFNISEDLCVALMSVLSDFGEAFAVLKLDRGGL
jgi:hypothetical protein